nr:hemolysin family protein [Protofrankia symbiont of Coriaria ruscifolia]
MIGDILGLVLIAALIAGNGLFVAAEFAFVAIDRSQLEQEARDGSHSAARVLRAVRSLSFQLSGAQLGITLTSLVLGYVAEPAIASLLLPAIRATGLPAGAGRAVAVAVALLIATVTQMVFGELFPKNVAVAAPVAVAQRVAGPQMLFSNICRPIITLLNGSANRLLRAMGIEPQTELRSARSPSELGWLVRSSAEHGTLPGNTASLLGRSLRLRERTAQDVMTPRVQVVALHADDSVTELLRVTEESGHSRFPVLRSAGNGEPATSADVTHAATGSHGSTSRNTGGHSTDSHDASGHSTGGHSTGGHGTAGPDASVPSADLPSPGGIAVVPGDVDDVVGVVHVKDAFGVPPADRATTPVSRLMVAPVVVPASLSCDDLLATLRGHSLQIAVVIDEYGGTAGVVTLEDLVEELVGRVLDEYDPPERPDATAGTDGSWSLSGLLRPDEVADLTGVRLPEGPYETVAGVILHRLGRIPEPGDQVDVDGHLLTVEEMDQHRINRIRLTGQPAHADQPRRAGSPADKPDKAGRSGGAYRSDQAHRSGRTEPSGQANRSGRTGGDNTAGADDADGRIRR